MTSLVEIYRRFPDREAAVAHLEQVRWPDGPTCPQCGTNTVARKAEAGQADRLQCWSCERSFSATVGTIFHNSHIDLQRWFLLIALMLNAKKGLSAMQAARDLEMRRPTVWSMMHRIRGAMQDDGKLLAGLVEMDEAYIGGKPRKRNRRDDDTPLPRGRGTSKTPVVGVVERGGRVKTKMVAHDEMTGDDMEMFTRETVDLKSSPWSVVLAVVVYAQQFVIRERRIERGVGVHHFVLARVTKSALASITPNFIDLAAQFEVRAQTILTHDWSPA
jgi:transposase-like protein